MSGSKHDYLTLVSAGSDELEAVLRRGVHPDPEKLVGWEFRGYNTLDLTTILGFRKFKKGFYKEGERYFGYNVKIKPNGLLEPWIDVVKNGKPVRHGFFDVYPVRAAETDNLYPNALLLNYASDKNPLWDPSRVLRDYLVQVHGDNPDLYLGKAYVAVGPKRLFVSFFVLERHNEASPD
ncbi:MAG: hypothetical protein D6806_13115 [Deltaproteobacteria bacterium]|nr:MAG: hypothetical protein D6806_13115 [Deltaproteobacteria bacterium]